MGVIRAINRFHTFLNVASSSDMVTSCVTIRSENDDHTDAMTMMEDKVPNIAFASNQNSIPTLTDINIEKNHIHNDIFCHLFILWSSFRTPSNPLTNIMSTISLNQDVCVRFMSGIDLLNEVVESCIAGSIS